MGFFRTMDRVAVADAAMFRSMTDAMPINVMVADPETLNILYANEKSFETLRRLEHLLPIKADDLLGTCIDIFHKNPSMQRELLKDSSRLLTKLTPVDRPEPKKRELWE